MANNRTILYNTAITSVVIILAGLILIISFFSIISSEPSISNPRQQKFELQSDIFNQIVTPAKSDTAAPLDSNNFGRENPFQKVK